MTIPADVILEFARNLTTHAVDLSELAVTAPMDACEAQNKYEAVMDLAETFRREYLNAVETREQFK